MIGCRSSAFFLVLLAQFGCARAPQVSDAWKQFSGENALTHVEHLVNFGPRPAGSEALEESRNYIITQLEGVGWSVTRQPFVAPTPRGPVQFINLIAHFSGGDIPARSDTQRVIVGSHYDTKLFDTIRFVGANDAGSSTGALIEIARVAALEPELARHLELVFFDGEEAIAEYDEHDGLYGSLYYSKQLVSNNRTNQFRYAIVLDMIGEHDLTITLSPDSPPDLVRGILRAADELGLRGHFSFHSSPILDDHVPLNQIGIPAITLIDFDFPEWHTAGDTLEVLSAESLRKIGQLTLFFLSQTMH